MLKPNIYLHSLDGESDSELVNILNKKGNVLNEHETDQGVNWRALSDSDVVVAHSRGKCLDPNSELSFALDVRRIPVLVDCEVEGTVEEESHPLLTVSEGLDIGHLESNIDDFLVKNPPLGEFRDNFILCDGIDGSGKGVVSKTIGDYFGKNNSDVMDATQFSKDEGFIPPWEEIAGNFPEGGALLVAEPTYCGIGKIIREELIKKGSKHDVRTIAQAYAEDRKDLFDRLVGPAIEAGITVVMDRGVFATQVYQPIQGEMFENLDREQMLSYVRGLEGNQEEMAYVPGLIILPDVDPEIAMARLETRSKQDDALFEQHRFQAEIAEVYASRRIEDWYARRGSEIIHLPQNEGEGPRVTRERTIEAYENYLDSILS